MPAKVDREEKRTQKTSLSTGTARTSEMTPARLATASALVQERPMHKPSTPSLPCSNMATSLTRGAHAHHNNGQSEVAVGTLVICDRLGR